MPQVFDPQDYGSYVQQDFRHRWLRPHFLYEKLEKFQNHGILKISEVGKSVENRPIVSVKFGTGKTKILLWSQMHGNEPTATLAMVDLFNFLSKSDSYDDFRNFLSEQLTLVYVPMVNPDGAENFTRENILGVDLNRDALSQKMPETKILTALAKAEKLDWAFNLHDQRNIFSVGDSRKSATVSFLAPSVSEKREMNESREKAMKLITGITKLVEKELPNHCARFSDEYYPRAIGDWFQNQGVATVLIESGAYPDDPFRDRARRLNFLCLLEAFRQIADGSFQQNNLEDYHQIPENSKNQLDWIFRDCKIEKNGQTFTVDVGLLQKERPNLETGKLETHFEIEEIGDLRHKFGLKEEKNGKILNHTFPIIIGQKVDFIFLKENGRKLTF